MLRHREGEEAGPRAEQEGPRNSLSPPPNHRCHCASSPNPPRPFSIGARVRLKRRLCYIVTPLLKTLSGSLLPLKSILFDRANQSLKGWPWPALRTHLSQHQDPPPTLRRRAPLQHPTELSVFASQTLQLSPAFTHIASYSTSSLLAASHLFLRSPLGRHFFLRASPDPLNQALKPHLYGLKIVCTSPTRQYYGCLTICPHWTESRSHISN